MGATTFYLLELEKKQRKQLERQKQETENQISEDTEIDYNKLTKDEIKSILDEKGVDYDSRAKKDELIKLLKKVK
ncbi:HeH/LEM domain-containing protein [Caloranaerobacter azorensis DSM 13643]|uniref:HeH/LEM domain-containing protein n=1 Tax=Caloranaerobacter azorensis DSM 13643 TaxID=1121264 RepID=A0A1M5TWD7_9FIRM|nr:HeH/LEM domain-containing protein [Caloranaerobacter azorensis]SHH54916.1 HeH/LEM domain-containing protein [Caloranaerobacter azorensis DSM 13643]